MSTAARPYYEGWTSILTSRPLFESRDALLASRSLPGILDGNPVPLLSAQETPVLELVAARFAALTRDVEPFVLDAVRYTFPRRVTDATWEKMRGLPRYQPKTMRADKYAAGRMASHLLAPAENARVILEALADEEVPERTYKLATSNRPIIRTEAQKIARVALLARTVQEDGEVSAAHLTILWGEYKTMPVHQGPFGKVRIEQGFMSPRYFGAPVLGQELSGLPPVVM